MSVRKDTNRNGRKVIVVDRKWPDGKRFRRQMPNQAIARDLDGRIQAAVLMGTWRELRDELLYGARATWTLAEFSEHYLEVYCQVHNRASSCARKRTSLKHILEFLGERTLGDIRMSDVHRFVAWRIKQNVKPATVNRDLTVLRHMYEFAVDDGALRVNPVVRIRMLKEMRAERPRVNQRQYRKIRGRLPFPVRHIVTFIWETGCRPSEALALRRDQLDLKNQTAVFNLRKAGDNALMALTTRAVEAILAVPELPGCPFVFWNPKTATRYRQINETFSRARHKAGLEGIQLKDFRREAGIVMAESGQPLHVAQTQLGHSSIKTTEKYYAHFSPEFAVARAREALENRTDHGRPDGRQRRQKGGTPPESPPTEKPAKSRPRNILDFQQLREGVGGGGRIRTAE